MIIYEIVGTENHQVYQDLEIANGNRQYDFLRSLVLASVAINRAFLSAYLLKALNFHAITCLHVNAGEYRPCEVTITNSPHQPPQQYRVQALMDDFVNTVNAVWTSADPVQLASFVLWRLNWIHPFINGNGRTARAAAYFVLCARAGAWLPGTSILPELLSRERVRYVAALQKADQGDFADLVALMTELLQEQLNGQQTATTGPIATTGPAPAPSQGPAAGPQVGAATPPAAPPVTP